MSVGILQRFCMAAESGRPVLESPFSQNWNGESWGIGSDGTRMLMLAGVDVGRVDLGPKVQSVMSAFDGTSHECSVDLAALAAFVGVPADRGPCTACEGGRLTCPACHGSREVECECNCGDVHTKTCEDCLDSVDGRVLCRSCQGWRILHARKVMIGESLFDAGLVAGSLADAERCQDTATWVSTTPEAPHMLRGDGWMLIIMPRRMVMTNEGRELPRFDLAETAPAGAIDQETTARTT